MALDAARRGLPLRIFLFSLALYLLSGSGRVYTLDGVVMFRATESILSGGRMDVDPRGIPPGFLASGRDGLAYGKYGLGFSIAALPFGALGRGLAAWMPSAAVDLFDGPKVLSYKAHDRADAWFFFGTSLTNACVTAVLVTLLFLLALEIGHTTRVALAVAALAGLASPLWPYAKDGFAEPLSALLLLAFAWFMERGARRDAARTALLAGLALGGLVFVKAAHAALLPVCLLALASRWGKARIVRRAAPLVAGLGAGIALTLALNLARFGAPFRTGYEDELARWTTPPLTGLYGLLLSPGHGLVPYFPAVLLAALVTRGAWREQRALLILTWGTLGTLVALYATWHGWNGGWCFGPRFLVPVVPLLALAAARRRAPRILTIATVAGSFWMALTGTIVAYTDYHQAAVEAARGGAYWERLWWSWSAFPAWGYWTFPMKQYWLAPSLFRDPAGAPLAAAAAALLVLLAGALIARRRHVLIWAGAGVAGAGLAFLVSARSADPVVTHVDFEARRFPSGWVAEGDAFRGGPVDGGNGRRQASSLGGGALGATGILRSPEIVLRGTSVSFLIGGTNDPERVGVRLLSGGREIARQSGPGGNGVARVAWQLRIPAGERVVFEVFDQSGEGYVSLDDLRVRRGP